MLSCEMYREQMLDYLYDLLENEERQALETHVNGCPACQAELVKAKGQRQMLGMAAKMAFPDVRFTVPTAEPAAPPVVQLQRAERSPSVRLRKPARLRWAAAAAVLIALVGTAGWFGFDYQRTARAVGDGEERIAQATKAKTEAETRLAQAPREKQQRIEAIRREQREAQLQVRVQGPATLRAGAPTDYRIFTAKLNGQPAAAKIHVEVKDRGQSIGKPSAVATGAPGVYRLTLPPDLPMRPGSQPTLLVSARLGDDAKAELSEELQLVSPVYITHLEMDKPMYQLGETVHFRSLTLNRFSLKPAEEELHLQYELAMPSGEKRIVAQGKSALFTEGTPAEHVLPGPDGKPLRGIGAGSFRIDDNWGGGEYALTVREVNRRFPEQRRKFLINKYERPRMNNELDFSRKSYGLGDAVVARCKANFLDGRPVKDCPVRVRVMIDGRQYGADGKNSGETIAFRTDDAGLVNVRFKLPSEIERGLGSVSVEFADRAGPDTMVRPIPIVLKKLDVEFYPEGGDLVAGLPNRVYFQVRSTLGKPADLAGQLLEDGKPLGVKLQTLASEKDPELNQGMGRFEFTPRAGHRYEVKVESPIGVTQQYRLPDVKADGVVLSLPQGVIDTNGDIPVTVRSTAKRTLLVGAYCRGRLLDSAELDAAKEARAVLKPASGAGGVCRVTVFEMQPGDDARRTLKPVAERLIYRRPAERVQIAVKPDQKTYVPRQTVKLDVDTKTEKGEAAPSVVLLRVIDKSVVTLADDKTRRAMPTHFLLTTEVRGPEDLEYADFLLGSHPQAAEALDLLLGTQGWRRFAEQDPGKFLREGKQEAERLLVMSGSSQPHMTELTDRKLARVEEEHTRRLAELREQAKQAGKTERDADTDPAYKAAIVKLGDYRNFIDRMRQMGAPLAGALLLLPALICLIVALQRKSAFALPAAAGCAAAAVLLLSALWEVPHAQRKSYQVAEHLPKSPAPGASELATIEGAKKGMMVGKEMVRQKMAEARGGMPLPMAAAPAPPGMGNGAGMGKAPAGPRGFGGARPHAQLREAAAGDKGKGQQQIDVGKELQQDAFAFRAKLNAGQDKAKKDIAMAEEKNALAGLDVRDRKAEPMMERMGVARRPMLARRMAVADLAKRPAPPIWQAMPVRVFAHPRANGPAEERYDFAETLYWHPVLVLPDGKAEVSFDLCDSLGNFEVTAFAHTQDGRLGSATRLLTSRLPFTVQPRLPLEVTAGDKIDVAVAVANNTNETRTARVSVSEHANLSILGDKPADELSVPADTTMRKLYRFRPTIQEGTATLNFTGKADGFPADSVRATLRIVPEGFPIVASHSDVLEKSASHEVALPETWIKGTLKCSVQVYPSTLADLQKGLESLLREPNGCFEQTSTSNYPNLLILHYLKESDQTKPEMERRARELLDRGYQKLVSFECLNPGKNAKEGYEWFGGTAPAHEALTAYGLMQFRDMAKVREVDPSMLERTRKYLLGQRDGKGGFRRNPRALDTFGRAPDNITNAYIVWSLTESGKDDDIGKELDALSEQAKSSKDPYFLSLVANSLINRAKTAEAAKLLKKVAEAQKADGHLDAERTSITGSGGRDLQIETTALAVLGWLKANPGEFNAVVQKAVRWIGQQRGGYGGFGSTQSTILALKALIAHTKANKKTPESGELHLFVGEKPVASLPFAAGAAETLTLSVPDAETMLKPGKNRVRVEITGKNVFPYTLSWTYQTRQPRSADNCPVKLSAKLDRPKAAEGETVQLTAHVENVSGKGQGMTVAILGLPGGLTIPEDMKQLKDYIRPPTDGQRPRLSYFEIRGRELVLYWRDLAPDQKIELPIELICRVPGEYSGPASRAYLYYNADHKHWVEPLQMTIAAKEVSPTR